MDMNETEDDVVIDPETPPDLGEIAEPEPERDPEDDGTGDAHAPLIIAEPDADDEGPGGYGMGRARTPDEMVASPPPALTLIVEERAERDRRTYEVLRFESSTPLFAKLTTNGLAEEIFAPEGDLDPFGVALLDGLAARLSDGPMTILDTRTVKKAPPAKATAKTKKRATRVPVPTVVMFTDPEDAVYLDFIVRPTDVRAIIWPTGVVCFDAYVQSADKYVWVPFHDAMVKDMTRHRTMAIARAWGVVAPEETVDLRAPLF